MTDRTIRVDRDWQGLAMPSKSPPALVVVIDTEEEFDWNGPFNRSSRSTSNIAFQPLAQSVMDNYGVVPTYVVDYPVADTPAASTVLRTIAESGRCEIGAHLHPWVCPPHEEQVSEFHSFAGNLPPDLERRKLQALAACIEAAFAIRPKIYKAGRYGLGPSTLDTMKEVGFTIDVSVVPHTDFSDHYGPDFTDFPSAPFRTKQGIIALPLSVHFVGSLASAGPRLFPRLTGPSATRLHAPGIAARLGLIERLRLSPEGHSLEDLKRQTRAALNRGEKYFMLTYHSSSLLPGATDYVRSEADRTDFLARLDGYFSFFLKDCGGQAKSVTALASGLVNI